MVPELHSLMPPSFYSLAAAVRWVSAQHLNPETAFNLRHERQALSGLLVSIIVKQPTPPTLPLKTENHGNLITMGFLLLTLQGSIRA